MVPEGCGVRLSVEEVDGVVTRQGSVVAGWTGIFFRVKYVNIIVQIRRAFLFFGAHNSLLLRILLKDVVGHHKSID